MYVGSKLFSNLPRSWRFIDPNHLIIILKLGNHFIMVLDLLPIIHVKHLPACICL